MDEIIEIDPIGMKKLDNGQHVHFHGRAYDLVNEYEPAKIGLPEPLKTEWKGNIDTDVFFGIDVAFPLRFERLRETDFCRLVFVD